MQVHVLAIPFLPIPGPATVPERVPTGLHRGAPPRPGDTSRAAPPGAVA
jgi:hypothetical protein